MKKRFFETMLHSVGKIHVALGNVGMGMAWRSEEAAHVIGKMPGQANLTVSHDLHAGGAAEGFEVIEIQLKVSVDQGGHSSDLFAVGSGSVGREAHHFAFIAIL